MQRLIGRQVQINHGAMHPERFGTVYADNPEAVWVKMEDGAREYIAKFRLLCAEYPWGEVPQAVGVYLIAKEC